MSISLVSYVYGARVCESVCSHVCESVCVHACVKVCGHECVARMCASVGVQMCVHACVPVCVCVCVSCLPLPPLETESRWFVAMYIRLAACEFLITLFSPPPILPQELTYRHELQS